MTMTTTSACVCLPTSIPRIRFLSVTSAYVGGWYTKNRSYALFYVRKHSGILPPSPAIRHRIDTKFTIAAVVTKMNSRVKIFLDFSEGVISLFTFSHFRSRTGVPHACVVSCFAPLYLIPRPVSPRELQSYDIIVSFNDDAYSFNETTERIESDEEGKNKKILLRKSVAYTQRARYSRYSVYA